MINLTISLLCFLYQEKKNGINHFEQGLKKFPSSNPGQVDFLAGQVTNFSNGQGSR